MLEKIYVVLVSIVILPLCIYTCVGTSSRVEQIKSMAPKVIAERNWKIIRYEGWQYGSWEHHGGKVWYQVCESNDSNIQYRTFATLWNGELHFSYGAPIVLSRVNVNLKTNVQN
jgi:hypothetical protein